MAKHARLNQNKKRRAAHDATGDATGDEFRFSSSAPPSIVKKKMCRRRWRIFYYETTAPIQGRRVDKRSASTISSFPVDALRLSTLRERVFHLLG
uniref:Uncharacterized protein n=1 Tax=Candidatus Kentrum sp. UNK TaxID=2126344 RepID=A0A451AS44_9GAMM|nr:MAG: hypothetical protein BECKUNK1418G_GA0071005_12803 [Candidatus Kentron sp. UNK]VFK73720.1 MAG: hypothetical protein BECKUNK1418H_GA0071006_12613 [Candidatus Kentron sp. UNK]